MREPIITERTHIFDVNIIVSICADIKGNVTREQIQRAFDTAVASHGVFRTKVETDSDGNAFYIYAKTKQSLEFTDDSRDEIITREERRRFHIEDGEYLRAFVIGHSESGFSILFCMHHICGDGKSLVYFTETFMKALEGEETPYTELRHIRPADLPADSAMSGMTAWYAGSLAGRWKNRIFGFDELDRAYYSFWNTRSTNVQERIFDRKDTSEILLRCRQNECSFTAYITAVMLRNTGWRSIGYAVDGRTDGNRAMGNQATGISVDYTYAKGMSLESNAKRIYKKMHEKLDDPKKKWLMLHFLPALGGTLCDAIDLEAAKAYTSPASRAAAKVMGYGDKKKDLSITNLTKPDIQTQYGELSIEGMSFVPPIISSGKNIIGIVTVNGKMSVTLHTYGDTLKLDDLLRGM